MSTDSIPHNQTGDVTIDEPIKCLMILGLCEPPLDGGSLAISGGRTQWIGEHRIAHDFIELSPRTPTRIIEKCAPLYEEGLSLRDIEAQSGIPKSTIRETLTKSGFALRNPTNGNASKIDNKSNKRRGSTPFGYAYLEGKLLMDPKEQIALRKILKLWKDGKSYQAITDELNNQRIPTRSGKPWIRSVVRSIVVKAKEQ